MTRDARLMAMLQLTELRPGAKGQQDVVALAAEAVSAEEGVLCACCQKSFPSLKRHLLLEHGLDEASYRGRYGIPSDQPLVSGGYLARKRAVLSGCRGAALAR